MDESHRMLCHLIQSGRGTGAELVRASPVTKLWLAIG